MGELAVRAVDRESWPDFAALFESPGAPGYCRAGFEAVGKAGSRRQVIGLALSE